MTTRSAVSANTATTAAAALALALVAASASAHLLLEAEQLVQSAGVAISVPGYSVPSVADWDSDGLPDLIVGEGASTGKVRVYINGGTAASPEFSGFTYAQSMGSDLTIAGGG